MAISPFVKKEDKVPVEVFAWEESNGVGATYVKSEVPNGVTDIESMTFHFKRPNYDESNRIARRAAISARTGDDSDAVDMDIIGMQSEILSTLLVDWDIKDEKGSKVAVNARTTRDLQPAIARAAVTGFMDKVAM